MPFKSLTHGRHLSIFLFISTLLAGSSAYAIDLFTAGSTNTGSIGRLAAANSGTARTLNRVTSVGFTDGSPTNAGDGPCTVPSTVRLKSIGAIKNVVITPDQSINLNQTAFTSIIENPDSIAGLAAITDMTCLELDTITYGSEVAAFTVETSSFAITYTALGGVSGSDVVTKTLVD